jgi:hypothetical protein
VGGGAAQGLPLVLALDFLAGGPLHERPEDGGCCVACAPLWGCGEFAEDRGSVPGGAWGDGYEPAAVLCGVAHGCFPPLDVLCGRPCRGARSFKVHVWCGPSTLPAGAQLDCNTGNGSGVGATLVTR